MTPEERAAIVFDLVRDGFTATDGGVTVVASDAALDGAKVTVTLAATRDGAGLLLDNPFHFVNPPLGVADGDDVLVDPEAAVAGMLLDVVR